jgi:hypothetical protein
LLKKVKRGIENRIILKYTNMVKKMPYKNLLGAIWKDGLDSREDVIPILIPNFDHSPRSGNSNYIVVDSTPQNWDKQVKIVLSGVEQKNNKLVLLRAWNEWGEGNYMEPDLKYGKDFIQTLGENIRQE